MSEGPEEQYREAWRSYVLTKDADTKRSLEKHMDALQPQIATGPKDPKWAAFIDTLPGYREFWGRFGEECRDKIDQLKENLNG